MSDELNDYIDGLAIFAYRRNDKDFVIAREMTDNSGKVYLVEPVRVLVKENGDYAFYAMNFSWIDYDQSIFVSKEQVTFQAKYSYYRINLAKKLFLDGVITAEEIPEYSKEFQEHLSTINSLEDLDDYLLGQQLLGNN